jgi:hypothetical protein
MRSCGSGGSQIELRWAGEGWRRMGGQGCHCVFRGTDRVRPMAREMSYHGSHPVHRLRDILQVSQ